MQYNNLAQLELPTVMGHQYEEMPDDLFIPPNALEICLESFSGPLDLLLYLIKKENINILDLDVSKITDQYLEFIELMDSLKFDLAADYLVMAATLAEIKSRLMLPTESFDEEEDDPRLALIKRFQEYQRFKNVSQKIALLPRIDRDFFLAMMSIIMLASLGGPIITANRIVIIFWIFVALMCSKLNSVEDHNEELSIK